MKTTARNLSVVPPSWSPDIHRHETKPRPAGLLKFDSQLFFKPLGLRENPFSGTPDPRFLYPSGSHMEARSSLAIGIESGVGFQTLIAPPGMGKTTLLFDLLDEFKAEANTAFLFQVYSDPCDFLRSLMREFNLETSGRDTGDLFGGINNFLVRGRRMHKRTVLIIDEAQNLTNSILEIIRVLSNFETPGIKLLQIILSGQPQLARKLAMPELMQLQQRVAIRASLRRFTSEETKQYIGYRMKKAGREGPDLFVPAALHLIHEHSKGVPRDINNICFNSLLLVRALGENRVDEKAISEVINDLDLENAIPKTSMREPPPSDSQQYGAKASKGCTVPQTQSILLEADSGNTGSLSSLVEYAKQMTGADSVAILLPGECDLVCCAKSGIIGPPLGSRVNETAGFAALCLKTSIMQRCDDTDMDVRVDPALCRAQQIRSLVYVPIRDKESMVGMLALFSSHPHAFDSICKACLDDLAREIATCVCVKPLQSSSEHRTRNPVTQGISTNRSNVRATTHHAKTSPAFISPVTSDYLFGNAMDKPNGARGPLLFTVATVLIAAAVVCAFIPDLRSAIASEARHLTPKRIVSGPARRVTLQEHTSVPWPYRNNIASPKEVLLLIREGVPADSGDTLGGLLAAVAADQMQAEYELATRYASGAGVPQNYSKAAEFFKRAAEHGSATAQWKIGLSYLNGVGVPRDLALAVKWIQRSANQGKPLAQIALSQLYFQGMGVPRDLTQCYTWAQIASEKLGTDQSPNVDLIRSQLSQNQLADSNKRIAAWDKHRPVPRGLRPDGIEVKPN